MLARVYKYTLMIMVGLTLTSCATPTYKLYSGDSLPSKSIATLVESDLENGHINIDLVDGLKPPESGKLYYGSNITGAFRIELKPGKHSLSVRYGHYKYSSRKNRIIYFNAEAGKTYWVNVILNLKALYWKPIVEEVSEKQAKDANE